MKPFSSALPPGLLLLATPWPTVASPSHWKRADQVVLDPESRTGAVASEAKVCSQIGIDLLKSGGNAVDAFIGTQLCVGVVSMYHSGVGGGGFALIRDTHGEYVVIDYRESAPANASEDMYAGNVMGSIFGGLAAAIPGELRGLEYAHQKFGRLIWKDVVKPAAGVARHGFPVTEDMVKYMEYGVEFAGRNFLVEDPSWAQDFAPNGTLVTLGETMYRKRLADTLDRVAENGANEFYMGDIANATIYTIQSNNGTMTLEDLASYEVIVRKPVNISFHDFTLFSSGAPSSGAVGLSMLKTMEGYDDADTANVNLTTHRFDEAMRFAYGARQALGDPKFVNGLASLEEEILDATKAAWIRQHILDNATQPVENYNVSKIYAPDSHGTSHIVTADASGMAVSSTTTINLLFGNLLMVPSTGVILNNEMNDFSIPGVRNGFGYEPSAPNFISPGKRPLSSVSPIILEDTETGHLRAVLGAAGGSRITSATAQVAWRLLELGSPLVDAIRAPRFHDQLMPNVSTFEYAFDNATVASMAAKGHSVEWVRAGLSAVQGIQRKHDGCFEAVSETRQKNSGGLVL